MNLIYCHSSGDQAVLSQPGLDGGTGIVDFFATYGQPGGTVAPQQEAASSRSVVPSPLMAWVVTGWTILPVKS